MTGVSQARSRSPASVQTQQSWQAAIRQKPARAVPPNSDRRSFPKWVSTATKQRIADESRNRRAIDRDRDRWPSGFAKAYEAGLLREVRGRGHGQTALSASSPSVAKWKSGVVSFSTAIVPPKPPRPLRRSIQQVL